MTDTASDMPMLTGLGRRLNLASDFSKRAFVNEDMALYELFMHYMRAGRAQIDGVTFTGCRIEGPSIMLILPGTTFDNVNFGESRGDIGNMLLRPVRNMAIGAIPVVNCTFVGCEFHALGFTGSENIINELSAIRSVTNV
ncbi:hypothetical protein [Brevundimonas sp. NIBR11]|uniref:hypothetical protein n=1 Tax=Brevundimonas sp. NIBR11 TaxID=3015999 RepID=UPI0022F144DB|nr:hypothetical protein [Brevundimonas sp. NIBR11]WGM32403.1 hypothetical protein KKHFBJBL_02655 [Brevundimonas sp. NIBR11]